MRKLIFVILLVAWQMSAASSSTMPKIRVMGMGGYTCNYWYTQIFRLGVYYEGIQNGKKTIYPFLSFKELSEATSSSNPHKQLYEESLDWISGYFAAAQRFGKLSAKNPEQTSDVVLTEVFNICRQHPSMQVEQAASIAVKSMLKQ